MAGWFDEHYLNVQAKGLLLSTINITAPWNMLVSHENTNKVGRAYSGWPTRRLGQPSSIDNIKPCVWPVQLDGRIAERLTVITDESRYAVSHPIVV